MLNPQDHTDFYLNQTSNELLLQSICLLIQLHHSLYIWIELKYTFTHISIGEFLGRELLTWCTPTISPTQKFKNEISAIEPHEIVAILVSFFMVRKAPKFPEFNLHID